MKIKIAAGLMVGFYFALNSISVAQVVANGTYEVVNLNSGLALGTSGTSTGSQVQQQTYTAATTQKWMVTNLGNNVVEMSVSGTSEAMEVVGASTSINALLDLTTYTAATNQQWTITPSGSYLELVNVNSGLAANVPGWQTQSGVQLIQYYTPYSTNQEWTFMNTSGGTTSYSLTVNSGTGSGSYPSGTVVTVTANAPASGYVFAGWTGTTSALANPSAATTTLTMPAGATTITATYSLSGSSILANGTYKTVNLNSGLALAANGTTTGSPVQQQTYTGAATQQWALTNLGNNVVEMAESGAPSEAMEVIGSSTSINALLDVASYTGATNQQWTITPLSGYIELVNVNSGLAANVPGWQTQSGIQLIQYNSGYSTNQVWTFTAVGTTSYALTVNSGTGSGSYTAGATVTVTANAPASGYIFAGWTGATSALANPASATTTLTMPAAATAITATYAMSGGTPLVANGTYQVTNLNSSLALGASGATGGSQVQQQTYTAAATQKWVVNNLGNNLVEMSVSGTSEAMEVVGASTSINALLDLTTYTAATNQQWTITPSGSYLELVNVNSGLAANVPGWQTQSGVQLIQYYTPYSTNQEWTFSTVGGAATYALTVTNGAGTGAYAAGTAVTVTANAPASGYQFAGWTGATSALANPASATTTLTMPAAAAAITATYSAIPTYALTVNSGSGSGTYAAGTVVTVTAGAPANGYQFSGWTGATSALANPASATTTLTMPATAIAITATYSLINNTTYALTVSSGTGSGSYAAGTVVSIAASAPLAGQVFSQWTGGGSSIASATSANTTVTMPSSALTVTATYVSNSQGQTPVYGLAAMQQFSNLPYLNPSILAGGQSSFDRTGANYDSNNYLYTDASGDAVMLDQQGPGCVYRIWVTGSWTATDYLKVYFDGASTPQINIPLTTLFGGTTAPFLAPLVGNSSVSSGGFFCYLPLPYSSSIKITTSVAAKSPFFYNIGYHTYSPGTSVTTWTGSENSSAIQATWNNVGTDPKSTTGNVTATGSISSFAPGTTQTLLNVAGPNSLSSIKLNIPGISAASNTSSTAVDILNNTWINIYWDGASTPSVSAPIGAFFGLGRFGNSVPVESLPVGIDSGNNLYMYFPMPFAGNATVQLVNQRTSTTTGITYSIAYKPFTDSFTNVGYFTTSYRDDSVNAFDGNDKTILDTDGHGSFLGVVDSMSGATSRWYLEGDEKIFVDGSGSPVFQGTGTEDFFNGGYYFNGPFSLQMQGNTAHTVTATDNTAAYRFFLQDAILFRNHIRVAIEHGNENDSTEEMWTLAYYYFQPGSIATLTDLVNVGNATSESNHSYTVTSQTLSNSQSYTYEGNEGCISLIKITDDGRAFTGSSQFTANISSTNTGVILRRRFDQSVLNQSAPSQSANVYVNGSLVGTWYKAGGNPNHQWRDDDFMIPASFTSGKSQVQIKIQYLSGVAWNEYTYSVYSLSQQPASTYTLTTNAANGSVLLNPPGGVYPAGTVVSVTALPNNGYVFNNWSGALTTSADPTTLTMTGNQTITANFLAGTPSLGNSKSATNNLAQTGAGESAFYAIDHGGDALTVMTNGVKSESDDSYDQNFKSNDYWGITFNQVYGFNKVVYTTGGVFSDGGWFSSGLKVQVRQYGVWVDVTGASVSPAYPYINAAGTNIDYTFTFNNTWGDAIRIYGVPGMVSGDSYSFTAIGELGIYYTP